MGASPRIEGQTGEPEPAERASELCKSDHAPVARRSARLPLALRAAIYMVGIFAIELASGWLFDIAGMRIWDYRSRPWNVGGYITLTYAPAWYALGLVLERLHLVLDRAAAQMAGDGKA